MIFRQLFDRQTCTYTYLLADADTKEALLIDPVREQVDRDITLLEELGLTLRYTLETHIHADHVTSSAVLRQRLGSRSVVSSAGGANCADVQADHGETIKVGHIELEVRHTPGHTDGCVSYVLSDRSMVFTGDTLLIRGCGRTDFQQGDASRLYNSVHDQIFSLPDACAVYPGHDYKGRTRSSVAEEKAFNARLGGGKTEAEFVEIMDQLKLADPAKIDVAVPANLKCGWLPEDGEVPAAAPAAAPWAPIVRSGTGVPEVTAQWTHEHMGAFRAVDVRRPDEWVGELGHAEGAELVTLDHLAEAAAGWDRDAHYVVICRSGGRSGRGALAMESMGFHNVASMAGGMLDWNAKGLPVTR
jgi:glyoxylase-like metal-dependent hydrolase (beta-lactamase superfamily II)/rhodanese-related sulfurtransferase